MGFQHLGEFFALLTALFFSITSVAFELAGKKIGALTVNLLRLILAFFIIGTYTYLTRGMFLPSDATAECWIWLSLSGIVGIVIGDYCLFQSFIIIGARISMLIMSTAPILSGIIGYFFLKETMTPVQIIGMLVTIAGLGIVILKKSKKTESKNRLNYPIKGILLALVGSIGQAVGMILSKHGMGEYDAFAATHIRIISGIGAFIILFFLLKRWSYFFSAIKEKKAMRHLSIGAFFGPFLGVSFSLLAVKHTSTGVALTIMSIAPILLILPSIVIFKEKVTIREVVGAIITVSGVALFFL